MKFKKFLIIILSVALLCCFAVSTFATDATTAATIPDYGFYISPGEYVFDDDLSTNLSIVELSFAFTSELDGYPGVFSGLKFNLTTSEVLYYYYTVTSEFVQVYTFGGDWAPGARNIIVLDGFYIYDIDVYQWWQSNVTRVDPGYDNNLLDGILSSFTFIGEWIAGAANAVTPMFWDGEALTVVGTLSVAGLSFAVVFLLIALVSSFMKFRS